MFSLIISAKRCSKRNDLHRVCSGIAGDANLYTLFRIQGNPIDCPFGTEHGFKFSYDKGKGECEWPESELEPCTDTKRLMLNYQACPNVQGSELMSKYYSVKVVKFQKQLSLASILPKNYQIIMNLTQFRPLLLRFPTFSCLSKEYYLSIGSNTSF